MQRKNRHQLVIEGSRAIVSRNKKRGVIVVESRSQDSTPTTKKELKPRPKRALFEYRWRLPGSFENGKRR